MSFLEYFNKNVTKIRLVDKKKSWFMRLISFFITLGNKLSICNINDFITGYDTTIGRTIYAYPAWSWDQAPSSHILHELTHVAQFNLIMAIRYIFSSKWRMYYESECVQAELLFDPKAAQSSNWMNRRVKQFKGYGCKEGDIRSAIHHRMREIQTNSVKKNPRVVFDAYLKWKRENAKRQSSH